MEDIVKFLPTLFYGAILMVMIIIVLGLFFYFQKTTVIMNAIGTPAVMTYKLLSTPEFGTASFLGSTPKFIFRKSALDENNNKTVPNTDLDGSYYFIEVRDSEGHKWRFSNVNYDYSFNARLRAALPADEPDLDFCTDTKASYASYAASLNNDPFSGMSLPEMNVIITDGDRAAVGQVNVLVDPDSSYGDVKYPLCICDMACPADNGCKCSKKNSGCPKDEVARGETCA